MVDTAYRAVSDKGEFIEDMFVNTSFTDVIKRVLEESEDSEEDSEDEDRSYPDEELYDYVRFTIVDFHGISRSKVVPKARVHNFYKEGHSFFSGAIGFSLVGPLVASRDIPSVRDTHSGNVLAIPDMDTLHPLPLSGGGTYKFGQIFCETYFPSTRLPQTSNPRFMAKQQLSRLQQMGHQLKSSWELEVCILDEETLEPNFKRSIHVYSNAMFNKMEDILIKAEQTFQAMGIDIETLQTEAAPGQYEIATCPQIGIKQSDHLVIMKDTLRQISEEHKQKAVFMAQPYIRTAGQMYTSALNFNHSLTNSDETHIFSDIRSKDKLSATCKHWIAGLIKHSRALSALYNPTVNCYRRLHRPSNPHRANWGYDARATSYRVKNLSPKNTYIECRTPSGSANPYLVMAGTVAAGIDGLINKYDCPAAFVPESATGELLPTTLPEALKALQEDPYMVETLGKDFVDWFVLVKENEIKHFEGFDPNKDDETLLKKERDCYMDLV